MEARLGFNSVLHILRNPHGHSYDTQRAVRLEAADRMEELQNAYLNMRQWAEQNGLDTRCRAGSASDGVDSPDGGKR
jgi:hypothetical protein